MARLDRKTQELDDDDKEEGAGLIEVDLNLPSDKRPLTGWDMQTFMAKHNLGRLDVTYALAITTPLVLNKMMESRKSLGFSVELLLRLYDKVPGPAPWMKMTPNEGLELIYGDIMRMFEDTIHAEEARRVCERRMVQCFGRHITTAHRWFKLEGRSRQVVERVFAKLSEVGVGLVQDEACLQRRDLFEDISLQMHRVRGGVGFVEQLPTLDNPPLKRNRGPVKGSKRVRKNVPVVPVVSEGDGTAVQIPKTRGRKPKAPPAPAASPVSELGQLAATLGITEADLQALAAARKRIAA